MPATRLERLASSLSDRYRIERELGAGGMATVYLAEDLRHHRQVAVKVLRPELAAVIGAERFLAEISTTAKLQHPHILPLFDSGEADGFLFYVMPFIEGESLRDLLQREKQLPVDDAVRIATEIASALDYAHRHGVIHRDIKPENVLVHDGQALVADFGIALAASKAGGRMTETGMSLGTPQYMSPEQAMGEREITARSDVYALGAVTYEMLAGEPPFTGPTAQAIVAKVITEQPKPITAQRRTIPEHVEDAVLTALEKLPADRFATAALFSAALKGLPVAADSATRRTRRQLVPADGRWRRASYILGAVAAIALPLAVAGWMRRPQGADNLVTRFTVLLPNPGADAARRIALSPDGRTLAYADVSVSSRGGIYLRRLDRVEPELIPRTAGARTLAFSPDGSAIAFGALDYSLQIVSLTGGTPTVIARQIEWFSGVDWGEDGYIYYVDRANPVVHRVRATGGTPESLGTLDSSSYPVGFRAHRQPKAVGRGRAVFFSVYRGAGRDGEIGVIDPSTKKSRLLTNGRMVLGYRWGHLLFVGADGTLKAVRFDEDRLEIEGTPVALLANVATEESIAQIALSDAGTIAFSPSASFASEMVWVTREGIESPVNPEVRKSFDGVAISPRGDRIAMSALELDGKSSIWLYDIGQKTISRFTTDGGLNYRPAWSPDGKSVVFASDRGSTTGVRSLWIRPVDASDTARLLVSSPRHAQEISWAPSGWVAYREGYDDGGTLRDIRYFRPGVDTVTKSFISTRSDELNPALSPDSRWIAYLSNESGIDEIYVSPFPGPGGRTQISSGGGTRPVWSHGGRELFYRALDGQFMSVDVATGGAFAVLRRRRLFDAEAYRTDRNQEPYDIAPDDKRFLFIKQPASTGVEVVLGWDREAEAKLKR